MHGGACQIARRGSLNLRLVNRYVDGCRSCCAFARSTAT